MSGVAGTNNLRRSFSRGLAVNQIDAALTGALVKSQPSLGNIVLTDDEYLANVAFVVSGVSGPCSFVLPAIKRGLVLIKSDAANTHSVSVTRGASSVSLGVGQVALFYTDGTANGLTAFTGGADNVTATLPIKRVADDIEFDISDLGEQTAPAAGAVYGVVFDPTSPTGFYKVLLQNWPGTGSQITASLPIKRVGNDIELDAADLSEETAPDKNSVYVIVFDSGSPSGFYRVKLVNLPDNITASLPIKRVSNDIELDFVDLAEESSPDPTLTYAVVYDAGSPAGFYKVKLSNWPSSGTSLTAGAGIEISGTAIKQISQINTQTDNYTLVLTDAWKTVRMSKASALALTVPPNSSVAFEVGDEVQLGQVGAGVLTLRPGTGVTISSAEGQTVSPDTIVFDKQYRYGKLRKVATDAWEFSFYGPFGLGTASIHDAGDFLLKASNFADVPDPYVAKRNLLLGSAADYEASAFLQALSNFADVPDPYVAKRNLLLGSVADLEFGSAAEFLADSPHRAVTNWNYWAALLPATLTDAATISVDTSTFINATVTLGGNRTLGTPSSAKPGQLGWIKIVQDGTGSRTLAYGANWYFGQAGVPTLSTNPGATDLLFYYVVSTNFVFAYLAPNVGNTGTVSTGILDGLSPTGAWSMSRKLLTAYTANAGAFRHLTSGNVDTIYDQHNGASVGNDMLQATGGNRPLDATAGPLGIECATCDGATSYMTTAIGLSSRFIQTGNNHGMMIMSLIIDLFQSNGAGISTSDQVFTDQQEGFGIVLRNPLGSSIALTAGTIYAHANSGAEAAGVFYVAQGIPVVLTWRHDAASGLYLGVNGTETKATSATGAPAGNSSNTLNFGGRGNSFSKIRMFECATFNTDVSGSYAKVTSDFMARVGAGGSGVRIGTFF